MYLNTTPDLPPQKPNILELAELLRDHLPPLLVKAMRLKDLRRRCHELVVQHPRFREEAPLVLTGERCRRRRLRGQLTAVVVVAA